MSLRLLLKSGDTKFRLKASLCLEEKLIHYFMKGTQSQKNGSNKIHTGNGSKGCGMWASDEGSYLNGSIIVADGGITIS